jgi:uncharacterized repeat protein (TIGR02543 family)
MKKAGKVSLLLFTCMFVMSFFPMSANALGYGDWQYELNTSGEATITGFTGEGDITVPSEVVEGSDSHTVVSIASDVFAFRNITSISIPESVTSIDTGAFFECTTLQSIIFLGDNPTYKNDSKGVAFSKNGKVLFHYPANKSGATYTIPANVTTIGRCAFDHNQNLESIHLTDDVTTLEESSFWRCTSLTSFHITKNVQNIGESVFANCEALTAFTVAPENTAYIAANGVLLDASGKLLMQYPVGKPDSSYTVPQGVVTIGSGAFRGANRLTEVTLSNSVSEIIGSAFSFCESLKKINLNSGLKTIGSIAFQCCSSIKSVVIPSTVDTIEGMAFDGCGSLTGVYFLGVRPGIADNAFPAGFTLRYYKNNENSWKDYTGYPIRAFCYVSFDSREGSAVSTQMADFGGKAAKPANPTKPHCDFAGWYKDSTLKTAWNFGTDTVVSDTNLHAKWTPSIYTIKFNSGKGSKVADQRIAYGGKPQKPKDPVRTGCTFTAWYKDALFKQAWSFTSDTVKGNSTLYAKWKSNGTYAIKASANNSRYGKITGAGSAKGGETVKLTAIPANGCRFVKWTEGKRIVSKNAVYTFDACKARTLKAYFEKIGVPRITSAVLNGSDSARLKWSAAAGAAGYNVYRAASKNGTYKKIASGLNTAAYTDKGLKKGATYYYRIQAYCTAAGKTTSGGLSSAKSVTIPLSSR